MLHSAWINSSRPPESARELLRRHLVAVFLLLIMVFDSIVCLFFWGFCFRSLCFCIFMAWNVSLRLKISFYTVSSEDLSSRFKIPLGAFLSCRRQRQAWASGKTFQVSVVRCGFMLSQYCKKQHGSIWWCLYFRLMVVPSLQRRCLWGCSSLYFVTRSDFRCSFLPHLDFDHYDFLANMFQPRTPWQTAKKTHANWLFPSGQDLHCKGVLPKGFWFRHHWVAESTARFLWVEGHQSWV